LVGALAWIRTKDLRLRRATLYPAELQVHPRCGCEACGPLHDWQVALLGSHGPRMLGPAPSTAGPARGLLSLRSCCPPFGGRRSIQLSYKCILDAVAKHVGLLATGKSPSGLALTPSGSAPASTRCARGRRVQSSRGLRSRSRGRWQRPVRRWHAVATWRDRDAAIAGRV
jgi:hypothetical protein